MRRRRRALNTTAELDITSFMNLMIILVPVLLLSMVFSQITVLDLKLPNSAITIPEDNPDQNKVLEVIVYSDRFEVHYPRGFLLKTVPQKEDEYDYKMLSNVLQEIKRLLQEKGIEKRDITVLAQKNTSYQTIVSLMDTARSFKAVVAASVVNAELFPEVSIGDAPIAEDSEQAKMLDAAEVRGAQ